MVHVSRGRKTPQTYPMKIKWSRHETLLYLVLDLLTLNLAFLLLFMAVFKDYTLLFLPKHQLYWVFINFSWLLVAKLGEYDPTNRRRKTVIVYWEFVKAWVFNLIISLAVLSIFRTPFTTPWVLKMFALFLIFGGLGRAGMNAYLKEYRRKGFNFRRMVVVGVNPFSQDFVNEVIRNPQYGYKFSGFFSYSDEDHGDTPAHRFEEIHNFILQNNIQDVYISLPSEPDYRIKELIKFCHLNYINVNFLNEFIHLLNKKTIQVNMDYNGPTPIVSVAKEPLEMTINRVMKRVFDVLFSLALFILVFSWLFPIIALLVKLSSPGPVFFKQKRTGLDGEPFYCYKFRTMRPNKESDSKQATQNDARITKIGAILRKTSLDELPQFWNVLIGDMSVVGPRPHMLQHTKMYAKLIEPFMVRHWVKPGITGLAQSKGYRGETKEVRQMYQRVRMDVFYIQNWFFLFDIKIIYQTALNMITNRHAGS